MSDEGVKLTRAERDALELAVFWENHGAGIRSTHSGSYNAMLRRMEHKGLLSYAGEGPDADGETEGEFQVWKLTDAGRSALSSGGGGDDRP